MKKTNPNLILLDIRKIEDFAKAHIKGSKLIRFNEQSILDVPTNSTIVIIGDSEKQSQLIAEKLRKKIFNTHYLIGGIKNWTHGLYCTNINYVGKDYL